MKPKISFSLVACSAYGGPATVPEYHGGSKNAITFIVSFKSSMFKWKWK